MRRRSGQAGSVIGGCLIGSRTLWAGLVVLGLCACSGVVDSPEPEPEPVGGRGGASSSGGRGGAGTAGRGGSVAAGAGGSSGAEDGGGSGSGGSAGGAEPDAGSVVTPPPERDYCDAVTLVFSETCGNGSCHTNKGATIGDFGAGPEEAASYVGRGSVRDADCGLIINPVEPQQSLILTKVIGGYPTDQNCGGRMPVGSFEITDEQIDCISDWVEQFRQ
jgi:hypothetical protein